MYIGTLDDIITPLNKRQQTLDLMQQQGNEAVSQPATPAEPPRPQHALQNIA